MAKYKEYQLIILYLISKSLKQSASL